MTILKKQVKELLECEVTDSDFQEALTYARKKQAYIFATTKRTVALQDWYLAN